MDQLINAPAFEIAKSSMIPGDGEIATRPVCTRPTGETPRGSSSPLRVQVLFPVHRTMSPTWPTTNRLMTFGFDDTAAGTHRGKFGSGGGAGVGVYSPAAFHVNRTM